MLLRPLLLLSFPFLFLWYVLFIMNIMMLWNKCDRIGCDFQLEYLHYDMARVYDLNSLFAESISISSSQQRDEQDSGVNKQDQLPWFEPQVQETAWEAGWRWRPGGFFRSFLFGANLPNVYFVQTYPTFVWCKLTSCLFCPISCFRWRSSQSQPSILQGWNLNSIYICNRWDLIYLGQAKQRQEWEDDRCTSVFVHHLKYNEYQTFGLNTKCTIPNTIYVLPNTIYTTSNTKHKIPNTIYIIPNTAYTLHKPKYQTHHPNRSIQEWEETPNTYQKYQKPKYQKTTCTISNTKSKLQHTGVGGRHMPTLIHCPKYQKYQTRKTKIPKTTCTISNTKSKLQHTGVGRRQMPVPYSSTTRDCHHPARGGVAK